MTSGTLYADAPRRFRWPRWIADRAPVLIILLVLIVVWYIAAILMNMTLVRDAFERNDTAYSVMDLIAGTLDAERPLVAVVPKPGRTPSPSDLVTFLAERVPRWWLPDQWTFIDEIPKTSVGKFDKKVMRTAYADGQYDVQHVTLPK